VNVQALKKGVGIRVRLRSRRKTAGNCSSPSIFPNPDGHRTDYASPQQEHLSPIPRMMSSSLGRQSALDAASPSYTDATSQTGPNAPARFARGLPPSAAAQAIFGNPSYYPPSDQFVEQPIPSRQVSQQEGDAAFRYNVHSPEAHSESPLHDRNQSRSSSVNERSAGAGNRKRQTSAGLNEPQARTTSRHRSGLSIGGPGSGTTTGDDSASSSRRGSGPGRKRTGKDKESSSRGQSATPSGLRDSHGASTPDTLSGKMGDLRDPLADEEISTIFIVGFPDDITVCSCPLPSIPLLTDLSGARVREHVPLCPWVRGVIAQVSDIALSIQ
jgi:hypothetical protein